MIVLFYRLGFTLLHRCATVTDNTAAALAFFIIASEIFCQDLLGNEAIYFSKIYSTRPVDDNDDRICLTLSAETASIFAA